LYETAKKNIEGEITIEEADRLIHVYYETKDGKVEHGTEEADNREMHVSGRFVFKNDPVNDPVKMKPSEREQRILELLRDNSSLSRAKMAEMLGCTESTVKRALKAMGSENMIKRIGSDKKGEWIING